MERDPKTIGDDLGFILPLMDYRRPQRPFRSSKKLAEIAGVKPIHLHGLRHSHVAF